MDRQPRVAVSLAKPPPDELAIAKLLSLSRPPVINLRKSLRLTALRELLRMDEHSLRVCAPPQAPGGWV